MRKTGVFALAALSASSVFSATYYWKVASNVDGKWSDQENWSTVSKDGEAATSLPGEADTVENPLGNFKYANFLVGTDVAIKNFSGNYRYFVFKKDTDSEVEGKVKVTTKGTMGGGAYMYYRVYDGVILESPAGSTFNMAGGDANPGSVTVYDGGELHVLGAVNGRHYTFDVNEGGKVVWAPTSYSKTYDTNNRATEKFNINGGAVEFPSGLLCKGGAANKTNEVTVASGSVTIGGAIESQVQGYKFTLNGGRMSVTEDVTFGSLASLVVGKGKTVELDVANGKTLTVANCVMNADATLNMLGSGTLVLGEYPQSLGFCGSAIVVGATAEGTLPQLGSARSLDGNKVKVVLENLFRLAEGEYVLFTDVGDLTADDFVVEIDRKVNASIKVENGQCIVVMAGMKDSVFSSETVTDLDDPAGWAIEVVPSAEQSVSIEGAGTHPVMTASTTDFAGITLADSAELDIAAERSVNALTLSAGTKLAVAIAGIGHLTSEAYVGTEATEVCADPSDRPLADYEISATMGGTSWNILGQPAEAVIKKTNADGSLTVQFQRADDVWTKVAYVTFTKADGKITAKGVKGVYVSGNQVGKDMDTLSVNTGTYASADNAGGYGVKNVTLTYASYEIGGTVTAKGPFATVGEGAATVDVAANNILDLSGVTVTTEATLVKTGAGTIAFGETVPSTAEIREGSLALLPNVEYDLSGLVIAEDVTYLARTPEGFSPSYPQRVGRYIVLKAEGTYIGNGDWSEEQNWAGGKIAGAGTDVFISGAGTEVTISSDSTTMPASITVEDGATLVVKANVTLPKLTLAPTAAVRFGDDVATYAVSLSSTPVATFATTLGEIDIPSFSVATNVTLTVPGWTYFKNLDMTICGKITTPAANSGMVRFGYAAAGETSYLRLVCDGATIRPLVNQKNDDGAIGIVYPDKNGRVVVLDAIRMITTWFNPCEGWTEWRNLYIGAHNPQDEDAAFDMIWDNTRLECSWGTTIGGAAHLSFVNGANVKFAPACINHGAGNFFVTDSATITFDGASTCLEFAQANTGIDFSPDNANHRQVFFKNGARFIQNGITGNKNAIAVFENGVVEIPNNYRQYDVLRNVGSVEIVKDSTLIVKGVTEGQGDDWNRHVKFTNAPITGEGSLKIVNAAEDKAMEVTIVNGANTATGTASAETGAMLRFADGANWAGMVVADGNVGFAGETPATVSFAQVAFNGALPIRLILANEDDAVGAIDRINITGAGYSVVEGAVKPGLDVIMPEGFEPNSKTVYPLGTIPKTAALPVLKGRYWKVVTSEIEGDDENLAYGLKRNLGFCINFR